MGADHGPNKGELSANTLGADLAGASSDRDGSAERRRWPALAPALAVLGVGAATLLTLVLGERYSREYHRNVVDDALTSLQYAKNLALGNGLVFNVGEKVEGYTNFLWVVFMAPFYALCTRFGLNFVTVVVHVNIFIAALNLLLVYAIAQKLWKDDWFATCVAVGLCAVDNSYTVWPALGLEGHFLAFWLLLAVFFASSTYPRRGIAVGLALAAAHMTRPDAGLFDAFMLAALFGRSLYAAAPLWRARATATDSALGAINRAHVKARALAELDVALSALAAWVLVYGAYFAWRYHYYGWPFPNTYYVKIGSGKLDAWERGLTYVVSFFHERWWLPVLGLLGLFARTTTVARVLVLYLVAHTVYITYVGGDFFPGHRFFVPQIPLYALCCGVAAHALSGWVVRGRVQRLLAERWWLRLSAVAFALVVLLFPLQLVYRRGLELGPLENEVRRFGDDLSTNRRLMKWLRFNKPSRATLSTAQIGGAGFYGDFARVIDMAGIIDPVVAHRPVDNFGRGQAGHEKWASVSEILAQKPTYIQMGYLKEDYWSDGYYIDASMRLDLDRKVDGVWRRDELRDSGRYLEDTAVHFRPSELAGWKAIGDAFDRWPTPFDPAKPPLGTGTVGSHTNTGTSGNGDAATGQLVSPKFELKGTLMVLRVGGGFDPERLRVSLWIDGQRVFSETGYDSEQLSRRTWPIGAYRSKQAAIEIVDEATGAWGHIIVDEIIQWQGSL